MVPPTPTAARAVLSVDEVEEWAVLAAVPAEEPDVVVPATTRVSTLDDDASCEEDDKDTAEATIVDAMVAAVVDAIVDEAAEDESTVTDDDDHESTQLDDAASLEDDQMAEEDATEFQLSEDVELDQLSTVVVLHCWESDQTSELELAAHCVSVST